MRRIFWLTAAAALAVFCIVQDRVTAAGARRYVVLQREAIAGRGPAVTIDGIMQPAIDRSVRLALVWSGAVAACGFTAGLLAGRSGRRDVREAARQSPSVS